MTMYLGDLPEDSIAHFKWNTHAAAGGSITRATNGTISVYKADGITQSTAGITDTEDFDGLTGVHHCKIDTSADAFYATGNEYQVVLSAATIDGQVVNAVLAHFSIENRVPFVGALDELAQAAPSATPTQSAALMLLYMALRNKVDVTATFKEVHNDIGTVITKKALSDDGTTYSEAEMQAGP